MPALNPMGTAFIHEDVVYGDPSWDGDPAAYTIGLISSPLGFPMSSPLLKTVMPRTMV